ncbi:lysophospholipid acyltransferase family protein [Sulfurimonas sp.]|uniref:lysophospholipid acyltransferase family protein n=2 Tax=Sulfurimonas sp. TaxID=2022749 RepID=UPI002B497CA1|nr:lysophospholipid acyltransferase family protein [Sulfurimonas sp.]
MFKELGKIIFMAELGYKYIKIFKKTYFHPFITFRPAYKQLSDNRQAYSNAVLEFLNIKVELLGELPKKNKVLYAINHRSLLDIIVMESVFSKGNKNGTWIAKKELFDAFYGDFFKYSGCISVDLETGKGLLKFFKEVKKALTKIDDFNIYIFPEGERNKNDGILKFQNGAHKIAKSNKLDIAPIFIDDSLETIFKNAPYKETKIIRVHVGNLIKHDNLENDYIAFMNKAKG